MNNIKPIKFPLPKLVQQSQPSPNPVESVGYGQRYNSRTFKNKITLSLQHLTYHFIQCHVQFQAHGKTKQAVITFLDLFITLHIDPTIIFLPFVSKSYADRLKINSTIQFKNKNLSKNIYLSVRINENHTF